MIDAALIRRVMPLAGDRAEWAAEALESARKRWVSDNPAEVAHWLAQLAHESGQLKYTREIADGSAYEGRADLGNTQPGDGKRFRGRGFIQLTGRSNYAEYAAASGHNVVAQPELIEDVALAADVSGWFWSARRVWARTEGSADRVLAITKIINGGTNGLSHRRAFFERVRQAMGQPATPAPTMQDPAPIEHRDWPAEPPVPIGDVMNYGESKPMIPILPLITAVLPSIIGAIPELGKLFGSGSEVSQRNIAGATKVLEVVTQATGAVNAVDAAERIAADPAAADAARAAVQSIWFELVEAGGGGIDGARKADLARASSDWTWHKSASFMIALPLLAILTMAVASILFPALGGDWPADTRTAVVTLIVGSIIGSLCGYFFGSMTGKPGPR